MVPDARTVTRLERLFDQQMWVFGCDVRRPGDNLLVRRGLARTPAPEGSGASGVWTAREGALEVSLSSVGVTARWQGAVARLEREPMRRQIEQADAAALLQLFGWFATYEAWVAQTAGPGWREAALASRSRRPFVPAAELPLAWRAIAAEVGSTR